MNFIPNGEILDLEISLIRGRLEIVTADREDIVLTFPELRRHTAEELFRISYEDGLLLVKEHPWKKSAMPAAFLKNGVNHDLVLNLPAGLKLKGNISTVSGDIKAERLSGSLRLKTISGRMTFGHIESSRMKLQNIGGNLTIERMDGSISARIVSGKCLIQSGRITHFDFSSVSGDIAVIGDFDLERDSSVQTVSGDTLLTVNSSSGSGNIQISTLSGETVVKGEFPQERLEIKKRMPFLKNRPFKTFMPAVKHFVSSFTGMGVDEGVEIRASAKTEGNEQHIEQVLQMLSEGRITAEEAERLINALK